MFKNSQEQRGAIGGKLSFVAKFLRKTARKPPEANRLKKSVNLACETLASDNRGKGCSRDARMMALQLSACAILLASSCCLAGGHPTAVAADDSRPPLAGANSSSKLQRQTTTNSEPFSKVAGLYEPDSLVTIQGQQSFERFVQPIPLGRPSPGENALAKSNTTTATSNQDQHSNSNLLQPFDPENQTISLVQFYMATCPDCQGFSPYFKRLVADIGAHWRRLVRIAAVNCNDDLNINLCWQQNPNLIVPLVRWYTFPVILADFSESTGSVARTHGNRQLDYPIELLNVAHRSYIERQRRDLISLRRATLRFITSILDQLTSAAPAAANTTVAKETTAPNVAVPTNRTSAGKSRSDANLNLYESLPLRWKLMRPIGRRLAVTTALSSSANERGRLFIEQLDERVRDCIRESQLAQTNSGEGAIRLENFIVFERHNSFAGKTIVADWSNWTCSSELLDFKSDSTHSAFQDRKLMMVHYTSDFSLLSQLQLVDARGANGSSQLRQQPFALNEKEAIERAPLLFAFRLISPLPPTSQNGSQTMLNRLQLRLLGSNSSRPLALDYRSAGVGPSTRRRRSSTSVGDHSATPKSKASHATTTSSENNHKRALANHAEESSSSRLDRLSQRIWLEQYYTSRRRSLDSYNRRPLRYAALMAGETGPQAWRKRNRRSTAAGQQQPMANSRLLIENINWAPEELYPGEEALRYEFNQLVAGVLFGNTSWPIQVAGFRDGNQGEINITKTVDQNKIVAPKEEDLAMVRLTDYYKVLAEIVHRNMLSKAEQDGFQLLASSCFLRTLARNFPFQGGAVQRKSIARNYLELVQRQLLDKIQKRMPASENSPVSSLAPSTSVADAEQSNSNPLFLDPSLACGESAMIHKRRELRDRLSKLRVSSKDLELIQEEVRKKHDVGLPTEAHFKWSYCAGSSEYLRGHTCSLWLLFHTLTVHEYLEQINEAAHTRASSARQFKQNNQSPSEDNQSELVRGYKFVIKPNKLCDHAANVEERLLSRSPADLYVDAPNLVLPTIVNFVRFYMSCTNCASHFSCMVENSELNFTHQREPGDHLLWLWEGHNRVNLRTKQTHSEDPLHPKHVFPDYEACPACYLERPTNKIGQSSADIQSLDSLKFNRQELINFLVARYRRSAILNNKIRIEDLFRKPVLNLNATKSSVTTTTTTTITNTTVITIVT